MHSVCAYLPRATLIASAWLSCDCVTFLLQWIHFFIAIVLISFLCVGYFQYLHYTTFFCGFRNSFWVCAEVGAGAVVCPGPDRLRFVGGLSVL